MTHTLENKSEAYWALTGQLNIQNERTLNKGMDKLGDTYIYIYGKKCIVPQQFPWLWNRGEL